MEKAEAQVAQGDLEECAVGVELEAKSYANDTEGVQSHDPDTKDTEQSHDQDTKDTEQSHDLGHPESSGTN